MDRQFHIHVGEKRYRVFLQGGFFLKEIPTPYYHQHILPEIHVILAGDGTFVLDGSLHPVRSGDIIFIPSGQLHCFENCSEDFSDSPFSIDMENAPFSVVNISENALALFAKEIDSVQTTDDYLHLQAHLALICSYIDTTARCNTQRVENYSLIIDDFFEKKYNQDIHICDLAKDLYLSEKQTERLIIKYTGNTFKKELQKRRIEMAKYLLSLGKLSKSEVAFYVGYQSYSGFWKAYTQYMEEI